MHKLPSGMLYRVLKEGKKDGKKTSPNVGDSCEVTYSGKLKDGTPFDSGTTSFAPNQVRLPSRLANRAPRCVHAFRDALLFSWCTQCSCTQCVLCIIGVSGLDFGFSLPPKTLS